MDLGQKVEETILNLAMSLPMLITGFTQLKSSVDSLDFGKFAQQVQMSAEANEHAATASELKAKASEAQAKGDIDAVNALRIKA
jgi:hypothetical protein